MVRFVQSGNTSTGDEKSNLAQHVQPIIKLSPHRSSLKREARMVFAISIAVFFATAIAALLAFLLFSQKEEIKRHSRKSERKSELSSKSNWNWSCFRDGLCIGAALSSVCSATPPRRRDLSRPCRVGVTGVAAALCSRASATAVEI